MAASQLQIHPEVEDLDLLGIASEIAKDNPMASDQVIDAVTEMFLLLAENPESGTLYHPVRQHLKGIRMIPVVPYRNYLIYYRPLPNKAGARILYVLHASRDTAAFVREHGRL